MAAVTGAVTYYAIFKATTRNYSVKWYNHDGTSLLQEDPIVLYNGTVNYKGSTPTRSSTAQYNYEFIGWSTSMNSTSSSIVGNTSAKIIGNTNYYAAYTPTLRMYTVTVTKPLMAEEVWLSGESGSTAGFASGTQFKYGTTVYAGVKVASSTASIYNISNDACG